jgi:hypothetical protein
MITGPPGTNGALPVGVGHLIGRGYGYEVDPADGVDEIDSTTGISFVVGKVSPDCQDTEKIGISGEITMAVDSGDAVGKNAFIGSVSVESTDGNQMNAVIPSVTTEAEDSATSLASWQVIITTEVQDSETILALWEGSLAVESTDTDVTTLILPGIKRELTSHAMRLPTGRQVAIEYKESDNLPNIQFRLVDEDEEDLVLPDSATLIVKISDEERRVTEVEQPLERLENIYILRGDYLAGLVPGRYIGEVEIYYNTTLDMRSETFNLSITENLTYGQ